MTINNKIDLVVSFDTTGSMYPVLSQVRSEVGKFVETMFSEFTDLRIGVIAHGDYCDADDPYTIIAKELTRDKVGLCKFIKDVKKTYGGDADECYELVLNLAAGDTLGWRDDAQKIMIMIGDASPHSPMYSMNKDHLDWKKEASRLAERGIKVFAVHALSYYRSSSREFYKQVAKETLGTYLTLDQFNEVVELIKATVYQQGGEEKLNEYVTILRDNGMYTNSIEKNIKRLMGMVVEDDEYSYRRPSTSRTRRVSKHISDDSVVIKDMEDLVPVMPGRFQIMKVDENCDIKGFVTKNGIEFKKGRGFYELSKAETVQQYKEVIMMDKETGEMFNGAQVRKELGLQPQSEKGGVNERLHKDAAKKFRVFVQSTSVNRKLIAGTTFLYEISDMEDTGTVIKEADTAETIKVTPVPVIKDVETIRVTPVSVEELKCDDTDAAETIKVTPVTVIKEVKENKEDMKKKKDSIFADVKSAPEIVDPTLVDDKKVEKAEEVATKKKEKAEKKKADAEKKKADAAKEKKDKAMNKHFESFAKSVDKSNESIERIKTSCNKKNVTFAKNNLQKLIKEAEAIISLIEE